MLRRSYYLATASSVAQASTSKPNDEGVNYPSNSKRRFFFSMPNGNCLAKTNQKSHIAFLLKQLGTPMGAQGVSKT
jgi:hypothetical protein